MGFANASCDSLVLSANMNNRVNGEEEEEDEDEEEEDEEGELGGR